MQVLAPMFHARSVYYGSKSASPPFTMHFGCLQWCCALCGWAAVDAAFVGKACGNACVCREALLLPYVVLGCCLKLCVDAFPASVPGSEVLDPRIEH